MKPNHSGFSEPIIFNGKSSELASLKENNPPAVKDSKSQTIKPITWCYGYVPVVYFENKRVLFKEVKEKYLYVSLAPNCIDFKPPLSYLIDSFDYKKDFDEEAQAEYEEVVKAFEFDIDDYREHLVKVVRKLLWLGNDLDNIGLWLKMNRDNNPRFAYKFENYEIDEILTAAVLKQYQPKERVIVFNPERVHSISPILKEMEHQKAVSKFNQNLVNKSKKETVKDISEETKLCKQTVRKKLKKTGVKLKSKSEITKGMVSSWREKNKDGKQRQCVEDLQISLSSVKRYWR